MVLPGDSSILELLHPRRSSEPGRLQTAANSCQHGCPWLPSPGMPHGYARQNRLILHPGLLPRSFPAPPAPPSTLTPAPYLCILWRCRR